MAVIKIETIGVADVEATGGFNHTEIYIAELKHFETLTQPLERDGDGSATTLAELVEISADHTFLTGFGFTKVKAIQDTVSLESNGAGTPKKSSIFENKLVFEMLGSESDILGLQRYLKGKDVVVLATEAESGRLRQIGSARRGGTMSEYGAIIGANVEDDNVCKFTFMDKQKYPAPIYEGTITLQPAVV